METPTRQRSSQRTQGSERRREGSTRKMKFVNAGVDTEAFARRTKYLRELFLDPERRHAHPWTTIEKKILSLDWFHNPAKYKKWRPDQTEDMACRLFANIVFNYSHLAMTNVGYTVIHCRLINEFVNILGNYQLCFMVVRSEIGEQQTQDTLRPGLIWRGEQVSETLAERNALIYTSPMCEDYQCLYEGISFNIHTATLDDFQIKPPCEVCNARKIELRSRLYLPEIYFKAQVVGMAVTSAVVEGRRNYLAAIQKVDGTMHIIDVTKYLQVTLEIVHQWMLIHDAYVKRVRDLYKNCGIFTGKSEGNKAVRQKAKKGCCTGCLLTESEMKTLDELRNKAMDFELPSTPISLKGLDVSEQPFKGVAIPQFSRQSNVEFIYTSIENLRVVVPMYVAAMGTNSICLWAIGDVNDGGERQPLSVMQLPKGARPTDISSSLGIAKDYQSLLANKFQYEPLLYSTDDTGYLRMWSLGSSVCESALKIDSHALLSLAVNKRYPNLIAIGVETGKIKLYNLWKQCISLVGKSADVDLLRMTTIPSYLPHDVYEYVKWFHPVVKLVWVNDTFLMAQYAEPLYVRESANASTVAIWNMAKDIFDRSDAIMCHRSWSQDMTHTWHLSSRLVCLHGGHYASLGGVISSDCKWSNEHGIIAISSDATGQLHAYKPGVWTWTDYDDAFCLARLTGDAEFYKKVLERVTKEHDFLMNRNASEVMASSDLRKGRSKYSQYIEIAKSELKQLQDGQPLKNDIASLPIWAKHTLRLNNSCEKMVKKILKNIHDVEIMEHNLANNPVEHPTGVAQN
ncbi:hypothetical protein BBOV_III007390 [Babesia bovis T2Bo]|uniref:Uncharacterized protein n=1 Tax=Babesia bovis TaxID=5865 RepID=A7AP16_BABBO|nr:hypothetical protein BBOV_III007390 [Babesia bovis T2Bo]EDO08300.1 hypothetical protein BBOV_III007390 [Babesia bovis T2Bo]|eukprot:XP_001611868.1 hypothetical protein [Babesia bovis T2Bo]